MEVLYINTDGGARGNPGPAGIGVAFFDEKNNIIHSHKECVGVLTNNQAEYRAVIKALEILKKSKWFEKNNGDHKAKVVFRIDSQLVVEQICGRYKVKNDEIKNLLVKLNEVYSEIDIPVEFSYVRREENKIADKLVNKALDAAKKYRNE